MTPGTRTTKAAVAALVALAALPAAAPAARKHWKTRTVTYRDVTPWPGTVARAARMWNRLGGVRLVRTRRRAADIVVSAVERLPTDVAVTLAFTAHDGSFLAPVRVRISRSDVAGDPVRRLDVVAHELGHALGLEHSRVRCAVMHSRALEACRTAPEGFVRCGPQRSDYAKLRARYGGSLAHLHGGLCRDPASSAIFRGAHVRGPG